MFHISGKTGKVAISESGTRLSRSNWNRLSPYGDPLFNGVSPLLLQYRR